MMDALQQAQRAAQNADVLNRPNDPLQELEFAKMYAAISQAEQTKRIADALERWLSVQGVLPEFYEMVDRVRTAGDEGAPVEDDAGSWQAYQEFVRRSPHTAADPPSPLDNF